MTESEWLTCDDPTTMLAHLRAPSISDRQLRLFACACARQVWHLLTDERSRAAVEVAERYADGEATARELDAARDAAWYATSGADMDADRVAARKQQANLLRDIVGNPFRPVRLGEECGSCNGRGKLTQRLIDAGGEVYEIQTYCKRCLGEGRVGKRAWLTPTVLSLAQAAYDERNTDGSLDLLRLAVLADALEEAGCEPVLESEGPPKVWRQNPLLSHLRSPGPHVRGCWALDLILGKE